MHGFLNINKPSGLTSRDVVTRVSRLVGRKIKCGHAGTLDPLATGVLLVCLGKATKLVPHVHELDKAYIGRFLLGKKSNTDDVEGELVDVDLPSHLSRESIESVLPDFIGQVDQTPPAFSAIKIRGERAYKVARRGEEFDVPSRVVEIAALKLTDLTAESMELSMTCGTGTYVRSVGRDVAQKLGTSAVMSELVRTRIGPFRLEDSISLDSLSADNVSNFVLPPLSALPHLPQHEIDTSDAERIRFGQKIDCPQTLRSHEVVAAIDENENLVAVMKVRDHLLAPQIVFPDA